MKQFLNILIALDQFLFCLFTLGNSSPDETLSAASWRWEQEGKWYGEILRPFIDHLFWFDKQHCMTSWQSEVNRTQLPKEYK